MPKETPHDTGSASLAGIHRDRIAAATLEGMNITAQVPWTIFGALLVLNTLTRVTWVARSVGEVCPLFAPTVGALGAFLAASATAGLLGREGQTLRRTVVPTIYYVALTGALAMRAMHVLNGGDPLPGVTLP
jgi:L-lactate permease